MKAGAKRGREVSVGMGCSPGRVRSHGGSAGRGAKKGRRVIVRERAGEKAAYGANSVGG